MARPKPQAPADTQPSEGDSQNPKPQAPADPQPSEGDGPLACAMKIDAALGFGTRKRGEVVGSVRLDGVGQPDFETFEPAETLNKNEVELLKQNTHLIAVD